MEGEAECDWVKLPAQDKCLHKAWKARIAGYEEAAKSFGRLGDEKDPEFSKYLGIVKKFVVDSNAFAQEKGLDATLAFVENAAVAGKTCGDVVSGIIAKCLNSPKQRTKDKGIDVILMYIEIDKQEIVQEELIQGLENKQPKIVCGCLVTITKALREFGSKVISIKPLLKVIPKLLEDRDKLVREETKRLVIEIYRWIGAAIKPQMSHFQPIQIQELEAEFEKLPSEKATQTRFMRSQQDLKAKAEAAAVAAAAASTQRGGDGADAAVVSQPVEEEADPYDFAEPVDILSKLPKNFYTRIEEKKWQERKEALNELLVLCENMRLTPGDYHDLVKALKLVVVKDTNIMLVVIAVKCLTGLAKGLRKAFSHQANQCFSSVVERFKEKKPHVIAALREALDALFSSTTFDPVLEDILSFLSHKNPSIKAEIMTFLARAFRRSNPTVLNKKLLKVLYPPVVKNLNDSLLEVRDAACECLGVAMKVAGEKVLHSFLVDVDSIKLAKIKEFCDKPLDSGTAAPAKPETAEAARPATAPPATTAQAAPDAKKVKGGGGGAAKSKAAPKKVKKDETVEAEIPEEVVAVKAQELLGEETMKSIGSTEWKERLAGFESVTKTVCGLSGPDIPTQVLVRTICTKPGLKDTNFQVLKLRIELIGHLAKHGKFTKTSSSFVLGDLVAKISDPKNGGHVQESLLCIAEAISLEIISEEVLQAAFAQKNPKTQSESLNLITRSIKEFGFKVLAKSVIEYIKKAFLATNAAVRTAALGLLSVMYMHMGATLRMFFEDEKAALLQQIDAEFEKVKGEKLPAPTRRFKSADAGKEEGDGQDGAVVDEAEPVNPEDLISRTDISDLITDKLIEMLGDKNWKVRMEALENVAEILKEAKFIKPNVGSLMEALKPRLSDSNKLMVSVTIKLCSSLVTAMGSGFKNHIRVVGVGVLTCFGNSMPKVRQETAALMDLVVEKCSLVPFVEAEVLSDVFKLENPVLRSEFLGWLARQLPGHKQLPNELRVCSPSMLACLEDRNADVRKNAQEALMPFMMHVGYDSLLKAANKLKASSKDQLMPILEKARANLPAKPAKAAKAPAKPAPEEEKPPAEAGQARAASAKPKSGAAKKAAPAANKRKQADEDASPPMSINYTKEQRVKDEKAMKVLKWNFTEPRGEFVDQLKLQMEKNFSKTMMEYLFKDDFKFHIKAIDILLKIVEDHGDETIANLDLILKWFSLRFYDTNPSMLNRALDYLCALFPMLADHDYRVTDLEAHSFIPHLIEKVGSAKENVRKGVRTIFNLMCKVYPASKLFVYITDGLKSKNAKQRTECLEELGCMMEVFGLTVCQPSPTQCVKLISQHIADRDNGVRSAALNTLVTMYNIIGENLFKHTNNLSAKELALLEERIKRSQKTRGPNIVVPENQQALRPTTAPPSLKSQLTSNSDNTGRPRTSGGVPGTFKLDLTDHTDSSHTTNVPLVDYDLSDLHQPINMPKFTPRTVNNASEVSSEVAIVISQIGNKDPDISTHAIAQIDGVLQDSNRHEVLASHVDQLVIMINMQLKLCHTTHMSDENMMKQTVFKLYRVTMAIILTLFKSTSLTQNVARDILQDLISNLVSVMIDTRMESIPDGTQIVRSLNILVIKIIEFADPTNIVCALIKLLHDCLANDSVNNKSNFLNLILKCLWKNIRYTEKTIDKLKIDRVFLDCHKFFTAFPSRTWQKDSQDLPLRTIKTVIFTICKLKREKVLHHMNLVNFPDSEIYRYIHKLLKSDGVDVAAYLAQIASDSTTKGTDDSVNADENSTISNMSSKNGTNAERIPAPSHMAKRELAQSTHNTLSEILRKIGQKEHSKEGLNALYDFKLQHPDEDINHFFSNATEFFKMYIEQGLKNIEVERRSASTQSAPSSTAATDVAAAAVAQTTTQSTIAAAPSLAHRPSKDGCHRGYFESKLLELRARSGIDKNGIAPTPEVKSHDVIKTDTMSDAELPGVKTDVGERSMPSLRERELEKPEVGIDMSHVNMSQIRQRLEKIKKISTQE